MDLGHGDNYSRLSDNDSHTPAHIEGKVTVVPLDAEMHAFRVNRFRKHRRNEERLRRASCTLKGV